MEITIQLSGHVFFRCFHFHGMEILIQEKYEVFFEIQLEKVYFKKKKSNHLSTIVT